MQNVPGITIDLDGAKRLLTEFDAYKDSKALDIYLQCQTEGVSLSDYMEKLDPTPMSDDGTPLYPVDAFTRHLMARDIKLSGPTQARVCDLAASNVSYLMPEMVRREVVAGMEVSAKFSYKDCVAASVPSKTTTYHPLYIPRQNLSTAVSRRDKHLGERATQGKGGEFPRVSIRKREKDIVINDDGRVIEAAYQVIRDYGWSDFAVFLRLIGASISVDKLYDLYDLGITGDGTVGAATNTFNGTAGSLTYQDLIHNHASFDAPFQMDRILAPLTSFETILTLPQFQDPFAWGNKSFQITGEPVTPMGAKIKQIQTALAGAPTGTVIVTMDSRFAVKEVVSAQLSVEADKIISRKFEEAVVSEESEFCVIADGALSRIVWT